MIRTQEQEIELLIKMKEQYPNAIFKFGVLKMTGEQVLGRYSKVTQRFGRNLAQRKVVLRLQAVY